MQGGLVPAGITASLLCVLEKNLRQPIIDMRILRIFLTLCLSLVLLAACSKRMEPARFEVSHHVKGAACTQFWLKMEEILDRAGVRCAELGRVDGFPYLRLNGPLKEAAGWHLDKRATVGWIEMMRRADLQARYKELDRLADADFAAVCEAAGIDQCSVGRLRAYVARCSALILGDERNNEGYLDMVRRAAAASSARAGYGLRACFNDGDTLDGVLPRDIFKALTEPGSSSSSGYSLEKRIQTMKQQGFRR